MIIRPEKPADAAAIGEVVTAAFGQRQEAELVRGLRSEGDLVLSLVAEDDGAIIGHVAFSRVWIEHDGMRSPGIGLAPVSVLPTAAQGYGARTDRGRTSSPEDNRREDRVRAWRPGLLQAFRFLAETQRLSLHLSGRLPAGAAAVARRAH